MLPGFYPERLKSYIFIQQVINNRSQMKNEIIFSADCKAQAAVACSHILSAQGLQAWWIGSVKVAEQDATWPAAGSKMIWKAGGGTFKARIIEDARPERVVMEVITPSAETKISHSFVALPGGGTRYSKRVYEPRFPSATSRFFSPLIMWMLQFFVKREVKKAAAYADSVTSSSK
jgi:hypothetical protein